MLLAGIHSCDVVLSGFLIGCHGLSEAYPCCSGVNEHGQAKLSPWHPKLNSAPPSWS
jgi:hypothetical protein